MVENLVVQEEEEEKAEAALYSNIAQPLDSRLNTVGATLPTIQCCSLVEKKKSPSSELTDHLPLFQKSTLFNYNIHRKIEKSYKVCLVSFFLVPRCSVAFCYVLYNVLKSVYLSLPCGFYLMDTKEPNLVLTKDILAVSHFEDQWTASRHQKRGRFKAIPDDNFRIWIALRKWEWAGQRIERFKYVVVIFFCFL